MTIADQSFKGTPRFQSFGGGLFEARSGGENLVFTGTFNFTDSAEDIEQVGHVKSNKLSKIGLNLGFYWTSAASKVIPTAILEYKKKLYVAGIFDREGDNTGYFGGIAVYDEATGIWGTVGPNGRDFWNTKPSHMIIHNDQLVIAGAINYNNPGLPRLVDDTTFGPTLVAWNGVNYVALSHGASNVANFLVSFQGSIYISNSQSFP